jgi:predicted ester cyclase
MPAQDLEAITPECFEQVRQGDLACVDESIDVGETDHREPLGTEFTTHLKEIITMLREAFTGLRFEVHEVVSEGDIVAT